MRTPLRATVTAGALAASMLLPTTAPAGAAAWGDADTAPIAPGVQMFTDGAQCTANFVYEDASSIYLGYAAHCAGTGGSTETNGCDAGSLPLGTRVEIDGRNGQTYAGTLAYSSWLSMQSQPTRPNANACQYNDLALVRLDADRSQVTPTIPFWGGPEALGDATSTGETVHSYGNSSLRLGLSPLSPKQGVSLGTTGGGWNHPVYTVTPGIPGDSGSAFLDGDGNAIGVLSTLALAPLAGSNGVTDLRSALGWMISHGGPDATLVLGTEPFTPLF